ncbi:MAG: McrC family protein [Lysobacter sp.]|nr:McrC family protein [Lysobacter sp.]
MHSVTVREFARLTTHRVESSLDQATVSESAFHWLCQESARLRKSGAALVQIDDRRWLRLDNYVGVIETPCGTRIEVLPKHVDGDDETAVARRLLRTMLSRCLKLTARETGPTSIQAFDAPLTEWVMRQFLEGLDHLVKRGVRFDYHAVQEQQRYLRGRLDMPRQLRQPPGRQHLFQIEHDVFDADRPENRLLRSTLDRVCRLTRDARNWRLSHELATYLSPIPPSTDVATDFRRWRDDRLMAHYRPIRPWCSLILNEQSPLSIVGEWHGVSLLFPMERLFERYVEVCLRRTLPSDVQLTATASSQHLCSHLGQQWFQLQPDFLLQRGDMRWVLDTKWKRLDASLTSSKDKYGLSQADFYQLFAYGKHYLDGQGDLFLVYPMTASFNEPLPVFHYSEQMRLWVVPFDLEAGVIVGAPLPSFGLGDALQEAIAA